MAKRWNKNKLKAAGKALKKEGSTGADGVKDSDVVHVNRAEKAMLKRYGGSGKTNPKTGLKEYAGEIGRALGDIGGKAMSGKSTGSASKDQAIPATQASPTGKDENLGAAGATLGAAATEPLGGTTPAAPPGGIPGAHTDYKPGDVPAVKGADAIGIGATIAGGATLGALRAASVAVGEGDPLAEHMGKQVGWSGTGDTQGGRAGKATNADANKAPSLLSASTTSGSTSASESGSKTASAVGPDGKTITVNPDGTVRTQDTSVAGLRAQRRYGAKTASA